MNKEVVYIVSDGRPYAELRSWAERNIGVQGWCTSGGFDQPYFIILYDNATPKFSIEQHILIHTLRTGNRYTKLKIPIEEITEEDQI